MVIDFGFIKVLILLCFDGLWSFDDQNFFDYLSYYFGMYVGWKSKKDKGFNDIRYDI